MKHSNYTRKASHEHNGFTLMELMIVLAIMSILFGLAIPAVAAIQKNLQIARLDSHAKDIYLAVQNRLTSMKASGELVSFQKTMYNDLESHSYDPDHLDFKPQDWKDDENIIYQNFFYLLHSQTEGESLTAEGDYYLANQKANKMLIPDGTVTEAYLDAYYLVELNPSNGDLYSVFYSETPITMDTIKTLGGEGWNAEGSDYDGNPRDRKNRKATMLGYYTGGYTDVLTRQDLSTYDVVLDIVNKEDLYVKVQCDIGSDYFHRADIAAAVILSDKDGNKFTLNMPLDDPSIYGLADNFTTFTKYFLLDSMEADKDYKAQLKLLNNNVDPAGFKCGEDITATADINYMNRHTNTDDSTNYPYTDTENSLFGKAVNDTTNKTLDINVGYVRHMNNLNKFVGSEMTGAFNDPSSPYAITVKQTQDISFAANYIDTNGESQPLWEADALYMEVDPTDDTQSYLASFKQSDLFDGTKYVYFPMSYFEAINNDEIFRQGTLFDGQSNILRYFQIGSSSGGNVGLFGKATNVDLFRVILEDTKVTGSKKNVGGLVGSAKGTSVERCGIRLSTFDPTTNMYWKNMTDRVNYYTVAGNGDNAESVGGLIGAGEQMPSIYGSYAGVGVVADGNSHYVGGLAGTLAGTASAPIPVIGCYTSEPTIGNYGVGGLVGKSERANFEACYVAGNVSVANSWSDVAGGMVGQGYYNDFDSCFLYGQVVVPEGSSGKFGSMIGDGSDNTYSNCQYLKQTKYNEFTNDGNGVTSAAYDEMRSADENPIANCHPYTITGSALIFPFPMISVSSIDENGAEIDGSTSILDHWGDWPLPQAVQTSVVYYEKYADGTYGYYTATSMQGSDPGSDNEWILDTLSTMQGDYVVEDGYALLSSCALNKIEYKLNNGTMKSLSGSSLSLLESSNQIFNYVDASNTTVSRNEPVYIYKLQYDVQDNTNRDTLRRFYDQLQVTTYAETNPGEPYNTDFQFAVNGHFAKAAVNPTQEQAGMGAYMDPEDPILVDVRSARQLNMLSRYQYYWNDNREGNLFKFQQSINIDFANYTQSYYGQTYQFNKDGSTYANKPIGTMEHKFTNNYNGHSYKIIDYKQSLKSANGDTSAYAGLFGVIYHSTIEKVVLWASNPQEASAKVASDLRAGSDRQSVAIGALVGLVYNDGEARSSSQQSAVSGASVGEMYQVEPADTAHVYTSGSQVIFDDPQSYYTYKAYFHFAGLKPYTAYDVSANFSSGTKYNVKVSGLSQDMNKDIGAEGGKITAGYVKNQAFTPVDKLTFITGENVESIYLEIMLDRERYDKELEPSTFTVSNFAVSENTSVAVPKPGGEEVETGTQFDYGFTYNDAGITTVRNCAVSGYTVAYQGSSVSGDGHGAAVGGLVGYNMGQVYNCSVGYDNRDTNNNCMLDVSTSATSSGNLFIGGVAGSNANVLADCYSGGSIRATGDANGGSIHIGGVTGGYVTGAILADGKLTAQKAVLDCYSFSTLKSGDSSTAKSYYSGKSANFFMYGVADQGGNGSKQNVHRSYFYNDGDDAEVESLYKDKNATYTLYQLNGNIDKYTPWTDADITAGIDAVNAGNTSKVLTKVTYSYSQNFGGMKKMFLNETSGSEGGKFLMVYGPTSYGEGLIIPAGINVGPTDSYSAATLNTSCKLSGVTDKYKYWPSMYGGSFSAALYENSFPYDMTLAGNYPFPATVMAEDGYYVHYGDWPVPAGTITSITTSFEYDAMQGNFVIDNKYKNYEGSIDYFWQEWLDLLDSLKNYTFGTGDYIEVICEPVFQDPQPLSTKANCRLHMLYDAGSDEDEEEYRWVNGTYENGQVWEFLFDVEGNNLKLSEDPQIHFAPNMQNYTQWYKETFGIDNQLDLFTVKNITVNVYKSTETGTDPQSIVTTRTSKGTTTTVQGQNPYGDDVDENAVLLYSWDFEDENAQNILKTPGTANVIQGGIDSKRFAGEAAAGHSNKISLSSTTPNEVDIQIGPAFAEGGGKLNADDEYYQIVMDIYSSKGGVTWVPYIVSNGGNASFRGKTPVKLAAGTWTTVNYSFSSVGLNADTSSYIKWVAQSAIPDGTDLHFDNIRVYKLTTTPQTDPGQSSGGSTQKTYATTQPGTVNNGFLKASWKTSNGVSAFAYDGGTGTISLTSEKEGTSNGQSVTWGTFRDQYLDSLTANQYVLITIDGNFPNVTQGSLDLLRYQTAHDVREQSISSDEKQIVYRIDGPLRKSDPVGSGSILSYLNMHDETNTRSQAVGTSVTVAVYDKEKTIIPEQDGKIIKSWQSVGSLKGSLVSSGLTVNSATPGLSNSTSTTLQQFVDANSTLSENEYMVVRLVTTGTGFTAGGDNAIFQTGMYMKSNENARVESFQVNSKEMKFAVYGPLTDGSGVSLSFEYTNLMNLMSLSNTTIYIDIYDVNATGGDEPTGGHYETIDGQWVTNEAIAVNKDSTVSVNNNVLGTYDGEEMTFEAFINKMGPLSGSDAFIKADLVGDFGTPVKGVGRFSCYSDANLTATDFADGKASMTLTGEHQLKTNFSFYVTFTEGVAGNTGAATVTVNVHTTVWIPDEEPGANMKNGGAAIQKWVSNNGISYTYFENKTGTMSVYDAEVGTSGENTNITLGEFLAANSTLNSDQYLRVTFDVASNADYQFTGGSVSGSTMVVNQTIPGVIRSATATKAIYQIDGPLSITGAEANITSILAGVQAMPGKTFVTCTVEICDTTVTTTSTTETEPGETTTTIPANEALIVNGYFDNNADSWTTNGGASIDNHELRFASAGTATGTVQTAKLSPFTSYTVKAAITGGSVKMTVTNAAVHTTYTSTNGSLTFTTGATVTNVGFSISVEGTVSATIIVDDIVMLPTHQLVSVETPSIILHNSGAPEAVRDRADMAGENLITNGDFSTGDFSGWDTHSGNESTVVNGVANIAAGNKVNNSLRQTISVVAGTTYHISADVVSGSAGLYVNDDDTKQLASADAGQSISYDYVPSTTGNVVIVFYKYNGAFSIDNISVTTNGSTPVTPTTTTTQSGGSTSDDDNLLKNGNFSADSDWVLTSGVSINAAKSKLSFGKSADATEMSASQTVSVVSGKTYEISIGYQNFAAKEISIWVDGAKIASVTEQNNETTKTLTGTYTASSSGTVTVKFAKSPSGDKTCDMYSARMVETGSSPVVDPTDDYAYWNTSGGANYVFANGTGEVYVESDKAGFVDGTAKSLSSYLPSGSLKSTQTLYVGVYGVFDGIQSGSTMTINGATAVLESSTSRAVVFRLDGGSTFTNTNGIVLSMPGVTGISANVDTLVTVELLGDGGEEPPTPVSHTITITKGTANAPAAIVGTDITITADEAEPGYVFDKWTSTPSVVFADVNSASTTFTMADANVSITANYKKVDYAITVTNGEGGQTSSSASKTPANVGDLITLTAGTAANGYEFDKWVSGDVTINDATSATAASFTMPAKTVSIQATYKKVSLTVTVVDSPSSAVSTASSASQATAVIGDTITLTAGAPADGYQFVNWTSSDVTIQNAMSATAASFTMGGSSVTVTANYEPISYAVTVVGATSNKANAHVGEAVTVTPDTPEGMEFDYWSSSPEVTFNENTFTMPASAITVTANYKYVEYAVTVNGGSASIGGSTVTQAHIGQSVTVSLDTLPAGQTFNGWTAEGLTLTNPSATTFTFTMPAHAVSLTASTIGATYTVTVNTGANGNGTSTATPSSAGYNTQVSLVAAAPATGYKFKEWTTSTAGVTFASATSSTTTFMMPASDVAITATYEKDTYTYTVTGGTPATGSAQMGDSVTVNANAAETGKKFIGWTATGITLSEAQRTSAALIFDMPAGNVTLEANYDWDAYTITAINGTVTVDGVATTSAHAGQTVVVTATVPNGKKFSEWGSVSGIVLDSTKMKENPLTFTMPAASVSLTANMDIDSADLIINGSFAYGTNSSDSDWTLSGGATISDQKLTFANCKTTNGSAQATVQTSLLDPNTTYTVQGTISGTGLVEFEVLNSAIFTSYKSGNGYLTFTTGSTVSNIIFKVNVTANSSNSDTITVDDISMVKTSTIVTTKPNGSGGGGGNTPISGTNLIVNGNFEDGTTTGWTFETAVVVNGALNVTNGNSGTKGLKQTVDVINGHTYTLACNLTNVSGPLKVSFDGGVTYVATDITSGYHTWSHKATDNKLYLLFGGTAATFTIDDIVLVDSSDTASPANDKPDNAGEETEIITNGTLTTPDGWTFTDGASVYQGVCSIAKSGSIKQTVNVVSGVDYTVSVSYENFGGHLLQVTVDGQVIDSTSDQKSGTLTGTYHASASKAVEVVVERSGGDKSANIYSVSMTGAGGTGGGTGEDEPGTETIIAEWATTNGVSYVYCNGDGVVQVADTTAGMSSNTSTSFSSFIGAHSLAEGETMTISMHGYFRGVTGGTMSMYGVAATLVSANEDDVVFTISGPATFTGEHFMQYNLTGVNQIAANVDTSVKIQVSSGGSGEPVTEPTTEPTTIPTTEPSSVDPGEKVTLTIDVNEKSPNKDTIRHIQGTQEYNKGETATFTLTVKVYKPTDYNAAALKGFMPLTNCSFAKDPEITTDRGSNNFDVVYTFNVLMNGNVTVGGTIETPNYNPSTLEFIGGTSGGGSTSEDSTGNLLDDYAWNVTSGSMSDSGVLKTDGKKNFTASKADIALDAGTFTFTCDVVNNFSCGLKFTIGGQDVTVAAGATQAVSITLNESSSTTVGLKISTTADYPEGTATVTNMALVKQ